MYTVAIFHLGRERHLEVKFQHGTPWQYLILNFTVLTIIIIIIININLNHSAIFVADSFHDIHSLISQTRDTRLIGQHLDDKESNTMPSKSVIIFFEFYHPFVFNLNNI